MTEQEFHDSRIPFYIERNYEHDVKILPAGLSHKDAIPFWKYDAVEKYCVRGYIKDRVLMLYQGKDFEIPSATYDLEKLLRELQILSGSLDYIGLGCKVGEVGEVWEPLEKIEMSKHPKYISYMITIGGDAGWRFSNRKEWCSSEYILLFDSEKWTMETIAGEMKNIYNLYRNTHGFTYAEEYDNAIEYIKNLIARDGVYVRQGGLGATEEKIIDPPFSEVEIWNMNGMTYNPNYSKG